MVKEIHLVRKGIKNNSNVILEFIASAPVIMEMEPVPFQATIGIIT
jgi:hypothetical protein